jgi:hypothetical protein
VIFHNEISTISEVNIMKKTFDRGGFRPRGPPRGGRGRAPLKLEEFIALFMAKVLDTHKKYAQK